MIEAPPLAGDFGNYLAAQRRGAVAEFCRDRLDLLPPAVAGLVVPEVRRIESEAGAYPAYDAVLRTRDELTAAHVHDCYDEDLLRNAATRYARRCARMARIEDREGYARSVGVEPPRATDDPDNAEGRMRRLACDRWWRRRLRAAWTRRAEGALRDLGLVRRGRQPYASDQAVGARTGQRAKGHRWLADHRLVNEAGEQLELLTVAEHSLANPALRRGEFMCRVKGFERTGDRFGHVAEFATLTAPTEYHAQLAAGGANPHYRRLTVRAAQQWLCKQWAKVRAKLKRLSLLFYGVRVAEPHHDGTPHWHMLYWCRPADADLIRFILRSYFLSAGAPRPVLGTDPTGKDPGCHIERIDPEKGSAVGYVAKYVSKNIDGAGAIGAAEDEETGRPVSDSVARTDAWASLHGIRQFQQIGGPPIGLWREARRLREPVPDPDIESARCAADRGDFGAFIQRVGDIFVGRRTNMRIEKAETGERNAYGECRPALTVGLRCASSVVYTRLHRWRVERCSSSTATTKKHSSRDGPPLGDCRYGTHDPRRPNGSKMPQRSSGGRSNTWSAPDTRHTGTGCSGSDSLRPASGRLGPVAITVRGAPVPQAVEDWIWQQVTALMRPKTPDPPPH